MQRQRLTRRVSTPFVIVSVVFAIAFSVAAFVRAADQPIDLDKNAANGAESKISTKVLTTYPVKIENTIYNNAAGGSYTFQWPGAGPGGFSSFVTAGPGVGTVWTWSTVYQVYSISSPVTFKPERSLSVFGAPHQGIPPSSSSGGSFMVPGKSISPTSVTLSDTSLSSSLITFFSPKKTVATCGVQCITGECEMFLENKSAGEVTIASHQLDCCSDAHQLICDGDCKAYLTDTQNCGACGNVCATGEICSDGACVCPSGLTQCGTGCIDLQTDTSNCGACGTVCAADQTCSSGSCVCNPGLSQCGSGCTDLMTDSSNCGACGTTCATGATCSNGSCACPAGMVVCGGACVSLTSDPLNCGSCGNVCAANSICATGACSACRPPSGTACNNQCVNTHTDPNNCGGCGEVCDFSGCPSSGQGTCSQGSSCVCAPALTSSPTVQVRFKPTRRQERRQQRNHASAHSSARAIRSKPGTSTAALTSTAAVSRGSAATVVEAPVCELAPVVQTLPTGGTYTQTQTGGRFHKEVETSVSITMNGQLIAQGPCAQLVPVTNIDTSGVILAPSAVMTTDTSGDGLCQPGEARCDYRITLANLGDSTCLNPVATLSSPPDQFNPNDLVFLNTTASYPSFPAYPGDGQPLDKKTNSVSFSIAPPATQPDDVGRPFLMNVTCSNAPTPVLMPITLGFGHACVPANIDGETYDSINGFQAPVKATLVVQGNPVNYSTGNFNHGSTIPFKFALGCGGVVLTDAQINPNPEIVSLIHATLGPQSLVGINGDNNANPDDPHFSCTDTGCDYQFRTDPLPIGTYVIAIKLPDTRIFEAGFTISP